MAKLARALRSVGVLRGRVTAAELRELAASIAEGIRRGAPQGTFPASNQAQFSRNGSTRAAVRAELRKAFGKDFEALEKAGLIEIVERQDELPADVIGLFHKAWHGSPHDHDGFSLQHIGTGEGAQAYGWGMYFAWGHSVPTIGGLSSRAGVWLGRWPSPNEKCTHNGSGSRIR